jgi:integrase/recombinase XerD
MKPNPSPLHPVIEGYLTYLKEVQRKAEGTLRDIRCTLNRLSMAMESLRPGQALWQLTLPDYLCWLEQERQAGRCSGCLAKNLSHVRGLLNYAWRSGRSDRNVLDGFQLQDADRRQVPPVLSLADARALIEASPRATARQRRDRMIVLLFYGCGLRTSELCSLSIQDVERERRELLVQGKGGRQRNVPIPEGVYLELTAYLLDRGGQRGPLFYTSCKRCRLNSDEAGLVVRAAAQRAGIAGKITPKTLRHSYATHLMDRGVDLAVIATLMGHRSPTETGVYLHVLEGRTREAVNRLEPPQGGCL